MRRWSQLSAAVLVLVGVALGSAGQPVVVQPGSAGYSVAELAAFTEAYQRLSILLRNHNHGSQKVFGQDGWGARDFAAFTAGSLEWYGYETAIVELTAAGAAPRVWVLAALDLGTRTAWIPIEPLPNPGTAQKTLGLVAGAETSTASVLFDVAYLAYTGIVELAANVSPTAIIRPPSTDIAEQEDVAWFGNTSFDPDGMIVLYQWTFDDETQRVTTNYAQWFTFRSSGTHTVTLTVTDSRGAQASTSLTLYVLTSEEAYADCGCGK